MCAQRQDYLIRLIEELGRFVREAIGSRERPRVEAALPAIVQAQEQLFGRPAAEILTRSLADQLDLLAAGESAETAAGKCVTYAGILHLAARLYEETGRPALALGSRRLAADVLQAATARWPEQSAGMGHVAREFSALSE
jgi:hypothetical protein